MPTLRVLSWNIENFNFAKALQVYTQSAFALVAAVADIIVIQELTPNGGDASNAMQYTLQNLQALDGSWAGVLGPINALNAAGALVPTSERYGLFYRNSNIGSLAYAGGAFPAVCNVGANFAGSPFTSRNPYIFTFTLTIGGAAGQFLLLLTFHAPTSQAQIIADLNLLPVAELAPPIRAIVAGDFNTDGTFDAAAYNNLVTVSGYVNPAIGPSSLTSCLPTWGYNYLNHPYDRILHRGLVQAGGGGGTAFGAIDFVAPLLAGAGGGGPPYYINSFALNPICLGDALFLYQQISDHLPVFSRYTV
jgi:endonuclease/exonuclease/phosphatase family metal-dependent hydrolase